MNHIPDFKQMESMLHDLRLTEVMNLRLRCTQSLVLGSNMTKNTSHGELSK